MKFRGIGFVGLALVGVLTVASCSADSGNARLASPKPAGVDVLKVGLLLDSSGNQSFLNQPQQAAAKLAAEQINLAGGVNGNSVELLTALPGASVADQLNKLTEQKAAVVIGPTDSSKATEATEKLSKTQTVLISPANGATALSKLSSGGYYFRTAPTETMQATALAKLAVAKAKGGGVAIVHETDDSSSEIAQQTEKALKEQGVQQVTSIAADDAAAAANTARESAAASTIVIARQRSQQILAELGNAKISASGLILDDGATASYGAGLALGTLDGAQGLLPGVFPTATFQEELLKVDPTLKSLNYAAESYDAVVLAALAAIRAKDSSGPSIASRLIEVSGGSVAGSSAAGTKCKQLDECFALLSQNKPIDYDGLSGPVDFTEQGDIGVASYVLYRYGAGNLPIVSGAEQAKK